MDGKLTWFAGVGPLSESFHIINLLFTLPFITLVLIVEKLTSNRSQLMGIK